MISNPTDETQNEYRRLKKPAKRAAARGMKEEAVRKINELGRYPNNVFSERKIDSIDVVGGRCMLGNDGTLYHNEKDRPQH